MSEEKPPRFRLNLVRNQSPDRLDRKVLLVPVAFLAGLMILGDPMPEAHTGHEPPKPLKARSDKTTLNKKATAALREPTAVIPKALPVPPPAPPLRASTVQIRKGDTLASALGREGVTLQTAMGLAVSARPTYELARDLKPGESITLVFGPQDRLLGLGYALDDTNSLVMRLDSSSKGGFHAQKESWPVDQTLSQLARELGDTPLEELTSFSTLKQESALAVNQVIPIPTPDPKPTTTLAERATDKNTRAQRPPASPTKVASATPASSPKGRKAPPSSRPAGVEPALYNVLSNPLASLSETVRKGDTLAGLLGRHGVSPSVATQLDRESRPTFNRAGSLNPGQALRLAFDREGNLRGLTYPMDSDRIFWLTRNDKGKYVPHIEKKIFETRTTVVSGLINDSLYESASKSGLPESMVMRVAGLFESDVDFARDLRAGDRFTVVFEELFHEGEKVRPGEVLAAEFVNQNTTHKAFRYQNSKGNVGYYDQNGRNVRKMFIRAPLDFLRITSHFSKNRKHPIMGYSRAHTGVDYGAPSGTPVRAAADGVVAFRGVKGGYGNFLELRHNSKFSTAYAHLSRYAGHIKNGTRVRQGEVIAYVGSTGMSTGPHLHYEVRLSGKAVNPLKVQSPPADPLPATELARFKREVGSQMAMLDQGRTAVAKLSGEDQESQP